MSYIPHFFHNEKVLPFGITDQSSLSVYLRGTGKPLILRVYVEINPIKEDHNVYQGQQDMFNEEFDPTDMNKLDNEIGISEGKDLTEGSDLESNFPSTPTVGSNNPHTSQSSRVKNVRDDEIGFYKGMTFKNKQELANSLKIACLKKDFRLKKVINSRNVFFFKCSYPNCNWWLRAVKFTSSDMFAIRIYEKYHTCGSEHLTSHNPHAATKVISKYFENRFSNGKGLSTTDMLNQLRTELGYKVR